jgi:hypothetical protein
MSIRFCTKCNQGYSSWDHDKCPVCGNPTFRRGDSPETPPSAAATPTVSVQPETGGPVFCTGCGSSRIGASKFCANCGKEFQQKSYCPTCGQEWANAHIGLIGDAGGISSPVKVLPDYVYGESYDPMMDCPNCGSAGQRESCTVCRS